MLKSNLFRNSLSAWLMLALGLLATVYLSLHVKHDIETEADKQFGFACDQITLKIQERLTSYALILRGGAGFFASSSAIDRLMWRSYTDTLRADVPGVQGIGYAQVIQPDHLLSHINRIRGEGYPDYAVHPAGLRELYTAIVYLEPFNERNLRAFGYDMYSEPVRRSAMDQARDTGQAALSGKVELVQENGLEIQAGTLMYVPVYRNGMPKDTIEQRRAALTGWTYSPFRMKNLILGIIHDWDSREGKNVDLHIFDGAEATPATLLFDSKAPYAAESLTLFKQRRTADFNGQRWLLTFNQTGTSAGLSYAPAWTTLAGGMVLCGLLFVLMLSVINTKANAAHIAKKLTKEIRQREDLLKESEFRWKFALEGAGDGVWDWNVANGSVFFSRRWKAIIGYAEHEFENSFDLWKQHLHPDDIERTLAVLQGYFDGVIDAYRVEFRMRCKEGDWKWILARGKVVEFDDGGLPLRMIGTHTDISDRKNAEALICEHSEELNAIFSLSPDGFIAFDSQHRVKYVSPAFTRISSLEAGAVIGLGEEDFSERLANICVPVARFSGVAALRAKCRACAQGNHSGETNSYRQKIELSAVGKRVLEVGLQESQTASISQILYLRDITHETEVDSLKSEFLATAAHELRTPMASIYGFTELLLTHEFSEGEQSEFLHTIFKQSELMVSIIDELLDLARIEARRGKDFKITSINLNELLSEIVASYKTPGNRPSAVAPDAGNPIWVRADRNKLTQAISNVLSNAYKYSSEGGAVEIEFVLPTSTSPSGSGAGLIGTRITDHGIGMTPEQLSRVCERFYRANTSGKTPGTGLGMSIVKEIVGLHGGELEFASKVGLGSTVTLWLPVASAESL